MEKLIKNKLGQWSLSKTTLIPYPGAYNATNYNHQYSFLNDQQTKLAQDHMLKHYSDNKLPVKNMINNLTGKEEPHLLMARGVNDEFTWEPNAKGPNMMDWSTDPKHVKTTHHTVVGTGDYIKPDDKRIPGYTDEGDRGASIQFWVPISNVLGGRRYLADNHMQSESEDSAFNDNHVVIKPGRFPIHTKQMVRSPIGSDTVVGRPQIIK